MTNTWHVLVEETRTLERWLDHRRIETEHWSLAVSEPVAGPETAADRARELAGEYVPDWMARPDRPGDRPRRRAYLTAGGSWLVTLAHEKGRRDYCHLRITPAQMMLDEAETQR
ncbi:hypothetical protein [Streptomyces sp. NPDC086023]|uniref:hypothetical protein n=1 Tax=Streptomyces sp. NPDC086023 TaxID=3365746 RepID=UPI0037D8CE3D